MIPVAVQDSEEKPVASVKASYANFVWGIPYERDSLYPSLGFSTSDSGGRRKIIAVEKDSVPVKRGDAEVRIHAELRRTVKEKP